tara:strand:- start:3 stop:599 length:597 start_codon:yes stop_codon:yes gene_type:complete
MQTTSLAIPSLLSKTKNNLNINMYYEKSKGFDEPITILPYTQTSIIINNWLNATVALRLKQIDNILKSQIVNEEESVEEYIDNGLSKSIYEFKVFLSLNKVNINTVYFSWIPDSHKQNKQIIYLLGGKVNKNILEIYRIAQNPYAADQLMVKSEDMLLDLYNYHKDNNIIKEIRFDQLHKFDKRYLLSWNFKDNFRID